MPIHINKTNNSIDVILGYGDIGIGQIDSENYKGVGFVQLETSFGVDENIPEDQQQGINTTKVVLLLRNHRGLSQLRTSVAALEKHFGIHNQTFGDKIVDRLMAQLGEKEAEIERLKYELNEAYLKIKELDRV